MEQNKSNQCPACGLWAYHMYSGLNDDRKKICPDMAICRKCGFIYDEDTGLSELDQANNYRERFNNENN